MNKDYLRRFLGAYAIVGGVAGVVLTGAMGPRVSPKLAPEVRMEATIIFVLIAALFAMLIWAGVLILRRKGWGILLFGFAQIMQIPVLGPYLWVFCAGPYVMPAWTSDGWNIFVGIKASLFADWAAHEPVDLIGVNLVPGLILFLLSLLGEREKRALERATSG